MKAASSSLSREFKRLFRSMNFVSRHPAISRKGAQAERFAEVYQQLGMLWEFLALQCDHTEGWRTTREGAVVCKTCGTARNVTALAVVTAPGQEDRRPQAVPELLQDIPKQESRVDR